MYAVTVKIFAGRQRAFTMITFDAVIEYLHSPWNYNISRKYSLTAGAFQKFRNLQKSTETFFLRYTCICLGFVCRCHCEIWHACVNACVWCTFVKSAKEHFCCVCMRVCVCFRESLNMESTEAMVTQSESMQLPFVNAHQAYVKTIQWGEGYTHAVMSECTGVTDKKRNRG